jgi:hypothetical protein
MLLLLLAAVGLACAPSAAERRHEALVCPSRCEKELHICAASGTDDHTMSECFPVHQRCIEKCFPTTAATDARAWSR